MQADPTAYFFLVLCSSCVKCATILAPDAASGCPIAIPPPLAFVIARSNPSSFSTARYCAANASLTSTISISPSDKFALFRAPWMAVTGPMPMMDGSTPTACQLTIRARGVRPWRLTASSLATMTAAAPSLIPEALPAVVTPLGLKAGLSLARVAAVVCGRGCSSRARDSTPALVLSSIGTISASKRPAC
ncbi:hypothetical protein BC936DRAFT_148982 [Jimgerdemannia flammicorona]|uniref:Uncharacterized protein n=2 Tax=Jimgerdemannia flammicorona TaxID=994334 RepID=A0A433D1U3_9FUNG|nr:hypothetical protein BC936DRAFT_148982 [Jimgerdemannia flammicorona]RUS32714.1 hypothetical protein BC938DRAFT_474534 [Jimgerdemannia flammicorona]